MPYAPPALTPEQAAEFPGEDLERFALAWLTFQRSSPCTSDRATFPYFTIPKDAAMAEDDVLYGPDRELAYKNLMWAFRRCQRVRAFDRYFDDAHACYYGSASLPGLVLLRQWADEAVPAPGLYLSSLRGIQPESYDEIWLAVRNPKRLPKNMPAHARHAPLLAPSERLEKLRLSLVKSGNWDEAGFRSAWAPAYLQEMLRPEPLELLREIAAKSREGPVLVASQELYGSFGHRQLIGDIINAMRAGEEKEKEDAEDKTGAPAV